MTRLPKKVKTLYFSLKIKNKMFLIITVIMLAAGVLSWGIAQYAFQIYDGEIYRQSAKALNLSSYSIENEMKKIEKLSYRVATDTQIQALLAEIKQSGTEYDNFVMATNLQDRMLDLGAFDKYVYSLQLFDALGHEYAVGRQTITTAKKTIGQIERLAAENNGGIRWIFPRQTGDKLIAAREIRSFQNLALEKLGTIAVRVDMTGLFADNAKGLDKQGATFWIFRGDELLYPEKPSLPLPGVREALNEAQGYKIANIAGSRYFITFVSSAYTNWTYMIAIPFNGIFHDIIAVKRLVIPIYSGLFVLAIFLALRFVRGITGPIESLSAKMKRVQMGNFEVEQDAIDIPSSMDEVGLLHRNFRIMLQRINELITENYKKQLKIKETEFKALQAQINPHFLYNTLDSINWQARVNGEQQISRMVESLAFLLRSSISLKEPLIPLQQEIAIVRHYITIQQIRFEERLDFAMDIAIDYGDCQIPKLSLQPIVENAIQYGLEQLTTVCNIRISAIRKGDCLIISVEDNGPGMDARLLMQIRKGEVKSKGSGIGLHNIDERIKLLFGEEYGLEVYSERGVGTKVMLRLPFAGRSGHVQSAAG
ncbi:MAG TPA: sensor histidine kinase [Bacilli bacterium]